MGLKARCNLCGGAYQGEVCACARGRKPRLEVCACGEPAAEVWVDAAGEWAMCQGCLRQEAELQAFEADISGEVPAAS